MTVGAPSAEFDRDRFERDLVRDSGVGGMSPMLSSLGGVRGAWRELSRECEGLLDRWSSKASLG